MAETSKLKILHILDILRKTDERHPVSASQIAQELARRGIRAERKSIARDLACLEDAGYSILKCENHNLGWYMTDQEFEDHELKMLADAVAAAKLLTLEDSRRLISRIKKMATREGERLIDSTLVLDPALKLTDKQFNLKFDAVMRAIAERRMICFQYEDLKEGNRRTLRKDGRVYRASPYYLTMWGPEYFAVVNVPPHDGPAHFRIERMANVQMLDEPARPAGEIEGLKKIGQNGYTIGDYIRETVHLWGGEARRVTVSGIDHVRQDVMRKFGYDLHFRDLPDGRFIVDLKAAGGEGFYQWTAKYGDKIKVEAPAEAVEGYRAYLEQALAQYGKD